MAGRFRVPEDVDDPIAIAVFEELKTVDAAGEGGRVGGRVAGLVGAPNLDNVAELLGFVVDGVFVEAGGGGARGGAGDVAVYGENDGVGVAVGGKRGDEAGVGNEERAHAVPVALLTLRTRDDAVDGVEDGFGATDVGGLGDGPAGMSGDGSCEVRRSGRGGAGLGEGRRAGREEDEGGDDALRARELNHEVLGE